MTHWDEEQRSEAALSGFEHQKQSVPREATQMRLFVNRRSGVDHWSIPGHCETQHLLVLRWERERIVFENLSVFSDGNL